MKTLVLVYNFDHQIMAIRAKNLFKDSSVIVCRKSNNIIDTLRFIYAVLKYPSDIIYCFDIGLPPLAASLVAKIISFGRRKVVIDTGDLVYLFSKAERKYGPVHLFIIKIIEDLFIKIAGRIVVRAPYHKTYLEAVYRKKDVEYLPDGVDLERFKPGSGKDIRKKLGIDKSFVMGVMGNLFWIDEWKWCYGYYEMDALALLKNLDIKFLVVGDGRGLEKLKEKAKHLGIEGKVIFTGRVLHSEVCKYLNAMDVFVFTQPHHMQTKIRTCAKLPELLAAGSFIISTDIDEPMKFIKKNGAIVKFRGLKDISYPKRLADTIRTIYTNKQTTKSGLIGRPVAKKYFSYQVLRKQLRKILEKTFR